MRENLGWYIWDQYKNLRAPAVAEYFEFLDKAQWWTQEEVEQMQREKLTSLLKHAANKVPRYRKILRDCGVISKERVDLGNFGKIPPLTKQDMIDNLDELTSEDMDSRHAFVDQSGGSTGEPVTFIKDRSVAQWTAAVNLLRNDWAHLGIGYREAKFIGSEQTLHNRAGSIKQQILHKVTGRRLLNAFEMSTEGMRQHIKTLNDYQPHLIRGYNNCIHELAKFAHREGLKLHSPDVVMSSSGTLFPNMRTTIASHYRTRVFDLYGCREQAGVATSCPGHPELHVMAPMVFIELLDADNNPVEDGELGEIAITSLVNYSMPLIRYRIGDMARWVPEPCPCGRAWQRLAGITGRITDLFYLRDGGFVEPATISNIMGVFVNTGNIRKYQLIQEDYDRVRILLVPKSSNLSTAKEDCREDVEGLTRVVSKMMHDQAALEFEFVADIPPAPSGKFRYTISKVTPTI